MVRSAIGSRKIAVKRSGKADGRDARRYGGTKKGPVQTPPASAATGTTRKGSRGCMTRSVGNTMDASEPNHLLAAIIVVESLTTNTTLTQHLPFTMNRRHSSRSRSGLDASFQIPLSVDSTANNLLLDDDDLEHEFFDGFDFAIATPAHSRPSPANVLSSLNLKSHDEAQDFVSSDQENFDYDYAEEEREVELGSGDLEETPRAKRVLGTVVELTLTPRSRKNTPKGSRLPTSISSSPVRSEYHLKRRENDDAGSSPIRAMPSYRSPSKTPTAEPRSKGTLPPAYSIATPTGAPRSSKLSSAPRRDKAHLRSEAHESEAKTRHAPSSCSGSALLSESGVAEDSKMDHIAPAMKRKLSSDPRSPEKLFITKSTKPLHSKEPPSSSHRSRSGSRTGCASPSPPSRVDHNAVMLPIQEEEEESQDRDKRPSISKFNQKSDFSVTEDKPRNTYIGSTVERKATRASVPCASLSAADSGSRPRPASCRKPSEKRSGDTLDPKPLLKKRKTEGNIAKLDPTGEYSSLRHLDQRSIRTLVPVSADIAAVHDGQDLSMPSANPVAPDFNYRAASPSLIKQPSAESNPDLPSGDANVDSGPTESHEQSDEVQDFLLRYAKKYGLGTGVARNPSAVDLKKPLPAFSRPISSARTNATTSKRHNVVPDVVVPEIKRAQVRTTKFAAKPDVKGKDTPRDPHTKVSSGQTTSDERGPRSVPGTRKVPEKPAPPCRVADELKTTTVAPESMPSEAGLDQLLIPPDPPKAFPADNQYTVDVASRRPGGGNLNEGAVVPRGASSYRDKLAEPRMSSIAEESPADLESPVPLPPSATSGSRKVDTTMRPAKAGRATEASQGEPRTQRPEDGYLPLKPPGQSAARKKRITSERHADDMFARKQRDNYLQRGLDLTANSSRRHVRRPPLSNMSSNKSSKAVAPVPLIPLERATTQPPPSAAFSSISAAVAGLPGSMVSVLDLTSDTEDQKAEQRASPHLECGDHSEAIVQRKGESSKGNGKEARSDSLQKGKKNASDRIRLKEPSESNRQHTTTVPLSSTISDIVSFGQKIMGSFGLLGSRADIDVAERFPEMSQPHDLELDHRVSGEYRGSVIHYATAIPPDNALSPRQMTQDESGGQNDESAVTERPGGSGSDVTIAPSHSPRRPLKRSLEAKLRESVTEVDQDINLRATERSLKRPRIVDDEVAVAAGQAHSSDPWASDRSRKATTRQIISKTSATRGVSVTKRTRVSRSRTAAQSSEANSSDKASNGTDGFRVSDNLCRLTVPLAPTFTTDVLRQQRSLDNPERDVRDGQKDKAAKSADANEGKIIKPVNASIRPEESWKPTVPEVFRFESDSRVARKQDFLAKLNSWEERASRETSLNGPTSKNKLPDFKRRHVAQEARLAAMAARRREMVAPTVPISPQFVIDSRLAERHKFEEARRAKEAEAERIKEEERRARGEGEMREWREARKRAVPRANAVPEWYSQAPKRTVNSR